MLQSLLDNNLLVPALALSGAVLTFMALRFGWWLRAAVARRSERTLKQEVRDARATQPNLESALRRRDQTVQELQDQIRELQARTGEITRQKTETERRLQQLSSSNRGLTEELAALRSGNAMSDADALDLSVDTGDSAVSASAFNNEAQYEKLRLALVDRAARIEKLEAELKIERGRSDRHTAEEFAELTRQLRELEGTVNQQMQQLSAADAGRQSLEEIAERRTRTNRALKDQMLEAQNRAAAAQSSLEQAVTTVEAREASIRRLMSEKRDLEFSLREAHEDAADLRRQLADQSTANEVLRDTLADQLTELERSRQRLNAFDHTTDRASAQSQAGV